MEEDKPLIKKSQTQEHETTTKMFWLSSIYRVIKMIVAGIGLVAGGGTLIYGIVVSAPVFAVGGGLYFVTSLFLVFDSSKVLHDIKKAVDDLKTQITTFQEENEKLSATRAEFEKNNETFSASNNQLKERLAALSESERKLEHENHRLAEEVTRVQVQLEQLDRLKANYEVENSKLQKLTKQYGMENEELQQTAFAMAQIQTEIKSENDRLQELLQATEAQLKVMEAAKRHYEEENAKYQALIKQHEDQLQQSEAQLAAMKVQVEKLRELHENSKQLIRNLVDAGDMFTNFSSMLGTDVSKLDNVTEDITDAASQLNETIERLNATLTEEHFKRMDADGDGVVTTDEFQAYVKSQSLPHINQ